MKYKGMASYNTTSDREGRNVMSLGGTPLMKGVGMLVGNFELNP